MKNRSQIKILSQALYQSSAGKAKKDLDLILENFISYLKQKRLMHLLPDVIGELDNLYLAENNTVAAQIISKNSQSDKVIKQISKLIEKNSGWKSRVKEVIDEESLGGLVVRYKDKMVDMSLKKQVNNLAKQLID